MGWGCIKINIENKEFYRKKGLWFTMWYWKEIEVKVRGEKEGEKGGRVLFLKLGEVLKRTVNKRCEGLR